MKKNKIIALVFATIAFTGCFEIIETFTFNEDGSGVYIQKLDFSDIYKQTTDKIKKLPSNVKHKESNTDSIAYYKSKFDTVVGLSLNERVLLYNAYARLFSNENSGVLYLQVNYPFKSFEEYRVLQEALKKENGKYGLLEKLSTEVFYNGNFTPPKFIEIGRIRPDIRFPISNFIYTYTPNTFTRKMLDTIKNREVFEIENRFFKGLTDKKIKIKAVINLPKSYKNITANNADMSTNKRLVKLSTEVDWNEYNAGDKINFSIDY